MKPTSGTARIDGIDILENPVAAKRITGFIPDKPFIYEKLTGREFLRFIGGLYDLERKTTDKRIEELLELFEIKDWGDELVEGFSHGMRQKLVLSAALMHEPKALVVDEPMVGLDPRGSLLIKKIFKSICQKGVSIFMSTHSLDIAEELCDRIAIIHRGELIALGTREELKAQAATQESRLVEIFLQLTNAEPVKDLIEFLQN